MRPWREPPPSRPCRLPVRGRRAAAGRWRVSALLDAVDVDEALRCDLRHALQRANVPEAEALQVRQAHLARFTNVAKRVRPGVTPFGSVGHCTDTSAVENN